MNVYDFDNTIYDGESSFDLFFYYVKKKPSLLKMLPRVIGAFIKYKKGKISIDEMIKKYVPMIEQNSKGLVDYQNDPTEFWNAHMHKIKHFYKEIQKDDDLVITASPDYHIEEICKRLGIKSFIASEVNQSNGKIETVCLRHNKVKAFFERYPDRKIENFYTDSPKNDSPLIDIAEHAFVVKKNKITRIK